MTNCWLKTRGCEHRVKQDGAVGDVTVAILQASYRQRKIRSAAAPKGRSGHANGFGNVVANGGDRGSLRFSFRREFFRFFGGPSAFG